MAMEIASTGLVSAMNTFMEETAHTIAQAIQNPITKWYQWELSGFITNTPPREKMTSKSLFNL